MAFGDLGMFDCVNDLVKALQNNLLLGSVLDQPEMKKNINV